MLEGPDRLTIHSISDLLERNTERRTGNDWLKRPLTRYASLDKDDLRINWINWTTLVCPQPTISLNLKFENKIFTYLQCNEGLSVRCVFSMPFQYLLHFQVQHNPHQLADLLLCKSNECQEALQLWLHHLQFNKAVKFHVHNVQVNRLNYQRIWGYLH